MTWQALSVLLIDHSPDDRAILREALTLEGHKTIEASDGREGVRLFGEHRPDAVFVDTVMAEKDGFEPVRAILAIDPAAMVFSMSGKDADDDPQRSALWLGARRGFRKPLRPSELLNAVNESIPRSEVALPWKPDASRVRSNPYSFKSDSAEATDALQKDLEFLAHYFEYPEVSAFHEAVDRFIRSRSAPSFVRLAHSLRHVVGVKNEIDFIRRCSADHVVERLERLLVLLHIGLIELMERGGYLGFHDWMQRQLKDERCSLPTEASRPALKEYLRSMNARHVSEHGAAQALRDALKNGLRAEDQGRLLSAFAFSKKYRLGTRRPEPRHLHCRARSERGAWTEPFCIRCAAPTTTEIDRFLPVLAGELYRMRNAFVHSASGLGMAAAVDKGVVGIGTRTFIDAYFVGENRIVSYTVTLDINELTTILKRCIWARFSTAGP